MNLKAFFIFVFLACTNVFSFGQGTPPVINYFRTPDVLTFDSVNYKLVWSSHPAGFYYKHEYLPERENIDHFFNMVLIEFLKGDFTAKDLAANKIKELQLRKTTDALCNYAVIKSSNGNEYVLDFILSESGEGKLKTVEWNCYRYKEYTDKSGHKGVILFGVSNRAYDDDSLQFLKTLPQRRPKTRNNVIKFEIPAIEVE